MKNKINLIIIVVLLLVGGFVVLKYTQNNNSQNNTNNQNNIATTTETTVIDTSDWETYRSEKYGFEIKYPDNFVAKEYFYEKDENNISCDVFSGSDKEFSETKAGQGITKDKIFSFQIYTNPTKKCEENLITSHYGQLSANGSGEPIPSIYLGLEEEVINGKKFIRKDYLEVLPRLEERWEDNPARNFSIWELMINNNRYVFSYRFNRKYFDDSSTKEEFRKIISTFKSIN